MAEKTRRHWQDMQKVQFKHEYVIFFKLINNQARILAEKSLPLHFREAMDIYEKLIKVCKENVNNPHRVCEVNFQASRLCKQFKESKEIQYLNACVDWDAKPAQGKVACQFAVQAQDLLMEYATSQLKHGDSKQKVFQRNMTNVVALETKYKIFSIQNDYNSAIFYLERAIELDEKDRLYGQQKSLFECLLSLLKIEFDEDRVSQAKDLINGIEDTSTKNDFDFQLRKLLITREIPNDKEKLWDLRSKVLDFEESVKNIEIDHNTLCSKATEVWQKSISALDYATNDFKEVNSTSQVLFERKTYKTTNKIESLLKEFAMTGYPMSISVKKTPVIIKTETQLIDKFQKMRIDDVKENHPSLFQHILHQHNMHESLLEELRKVRNDTVIFPHQYDILKLIYFQTHSDPRPALLYKMQKEDLIQKTRKIYEFSVDMCKSFRETINK